VMPEDPGESGEPEENDGKEQDARGALLEQCAVCGICGEPYRHEEATPDEPSVYRCPSECQPAIAAEELEQRVGQAVMDRLCTPAGLARMAAAEQLLRHLGYDLRRPAPLSPAHAARQWTHDYDHGARRASIRDSLLAVVLNPSRSRHGETELFFAWRSPRTAS